MIAEECSSCPRSTSGSLLWQGGDGVGMPTIAARRSAVIERPRRPHPAEPTGRFCHLLARREGTGWSATTPREKPRNIRTGPASLTISRKAAPRLKFREHLSASTNPAGVAGVRAAVERSGRRGASTGRCHVNPSSSLLVQPASAVIAAATSATAVPKPLRQPARKRGPPSAG